MATRMRSAVLFKSENRFDSFGRKLSELGVKFTVLDFADPSWVDFDFNQVDFVIYFPSFQYSSDHPLALLEVHDNLLYIHRQNPHLRMFPDPKVIPYYNDKYRQYLFLKGNAFPTPATIPVYSEASIGQASKELGYPMVVKNRYGAGGGSVFKLESEAELRKYLKLSTMNFFSLSVARYFWSMITKRSFYYHLIKARRCIYPFLSPPILAQEFVKIDRDLKTVVGRQKVVEGHWRIKADEQMWKVNIDGGGIGEWSYIPDEALRLSVGLAEKLEAEWLNIDMVYDGTRFLITEFSPVWHHYRYREKASFVYKDDYNLDLPLEVSLDLEGLIVESLLREP